MILVAIERVILYYSGNTFSGNITPYEKGGYVHMIATSITKKGQVTIPKEIRDALGLKEHDKMIFILRGSEIMMRPLRGTILDLRGTVPPKERPEEFEKVRTRVKREQAKKIAENT
jgi:AbrB family looped-hinge helix DNA binding protein